MRLSNPLLLASLGVLIAAASCTLITDVDRSKIPDGVAGVPGSGGDPNTTPAGGQGGTATNGTGGDPQTQGGAGAGATSNGGQGGSPEGGVANGGADDGVGGSGDAGADGSGTAGAGGNN
jgi:hypothetical protein